MESAERVKKFKKKEKKAKKAEEAKVKRGKSETREDKEKLVFTYQPTEHPAYFDLAVEKKHVEHLSKKTINNENRLQIIYRILKD